MAFHCTGGRSALFVMPYENSGCAIGFHADDLPGCPDVVIRKKRKAIFVHGSSGISTRAAVSLGGQGPFGLIGLLGPSRTWRNHRRVRSRRAQGRKGGSWSVVAVGNEALAIRRLIRTEDATRSPKVPLASSASSTPSDLHTHGRVCVHGGSETQGGLVGSGGRACKRPNGANERIGSIFAEAMCELLHAQRLRM